MPKNGALNELESLPELSAIEAMRRNLLLGMYEGTTRDDAREVMQTVARKAKEGDMKAAKIYQDMGRATSPAATTNITHSAILMQGGRVDAVVHLRVLIAMLINLLGPKSTEDVAVNRHVSGATAIKALQCDWFERDGGKWGLTNKGRVEALDMPAMIEGKGAEDDE